MNKKYKTIQEAKAAHCKVEMARQARIRKAGLCLDCRQPVTGHRKGMVRCEKCAPSARISLSDVTIMAIKSAPKVHGQTRILAMRYGVNYCTVSKISKGKPFAKFINPNATWFKEWLKYKAMTPEQKQAYEQSLVKQNGRPAGSELRRLRQENKVLKEQYYRMSVENQQLKEMNAMLCRGSVVPLPTGNREQDEHRQAEHS